MYVYAKADVYNYWNVCVRRLVYIIHVPYWKNDIICIKVDSHLHIEMYVQWYNKNNIINFCPKVESYLGIKRCFFLQKKNTRDKTSFLAHVGRSEKGSYFSKPTPTHCITHQVSSEHTVAF